MVALVQATAVPKQVHACLVFSTSYTPGLCLLLCTAASDGQSANTSTTVLETIQHYTMVGGDGSMPAVATELLTEGLIMLTKHMICVSHSLLVHCR